MSGLLGQIWYKDVFISSALVSFMGHNQLAKEELDKMVPKEF